MALTLGLVFLCMCLRAEIAAAQCGVATILPTDVDPSIGDEYFTSQLTEPIARLHQKVTRILQASQVDVYSVAVVYRNSTVYTAGLVDTPFRIGSITKAFTALGPLLLREQGADVRLDDPVTKFLPRLPEKGITLRELMGHISGLPRNLCAGLYCDPALSEDESLELVAKMELARPRWSALPLYSNLGFAVLGRAWEKATSPRGTWSSFLKEHLWTPLGMNRTGVPADLGDEAELAPGDVGPYSANYSLGWQAPCGDMYSTARDLARFLKFLLRSTGLLAESAIREMTHPTTIFPDASSGLRGFALPWELIGVTPAGSNRTATLVTKNGGLGSYRSLIAFHPESQLGVAVLTSTNATTSVTFELLGLLIMEDLIPAVQATHARFVASLYSGAYVCDSTNAVVSAHIKNTTFQVLGGSVHVTTATLDHNLVANYNVSLIQNGIHFFLVGSRSLVPAPGPARHAFWSAPGNCFSIASVLGSGPEIARPYFPGSVDLYEFHFDPEAKSMRWPAFGAVCHRS